MWKQLQQPDGGPLTSLRQPASRIAHLTRGTTCRQWCSATVLQDATKLIARHATTMTASLVRAAGEHVRHVDINIEQNVSEIWRQVGCPISLSNSAAANAWARAGIALKGQ